MRARTIVRVGIFAFFAACSSQALASTAGAGGGGGGGALSRPDALIGGTSTNIPGGFVYSPWLAYGDDGGTTHVGNGWIAPLWSSMVSVTKVGNGWVSPYSYVDPPNYVYALDIEPLGVTTWEFTPGLLLTGNEGAHGLRGK